MWLDIEPSDAISLPLFRNAAAPAPITLSVKNISTAPVAYKIKGTRNIPVSLDSGRGVIDAGETKIMNLYLRDSRMNAFLSMTREVAEQSLKSERLFIHSCPIDEISYSTINTAPSDARTAEFVRVWGVWSTEASQEQSVGFRLMEPYPVYLTVEPFDTISLHLSRDVAATTTISITNNAQTQVAFIISLTDPDRASKFRVKPNSGYLEVGETKTITFTLVKRECNFYLDLDSVKTLQQLNVTSVLDLTSRIPLTEKLAIQSCPFDATVNPLLASLRSEDDPKRRIDECQRIMTRRSEIPVIRFLGIVLLAGDKEKTFSATSSAECGEQSIVSCSNHVAIPDASLSCDTKSQDIRSACSNNTAVVLALEPSNKVHKDQLRCSRSCFEALPEDIVCSIFHNYLNGSLLSLRCVSRDWNVHVLKTIGMFSSLVIKCLPVKIPNYYCGSVVVRPSLHWWERVDSTTAVKLVCDAVQTNWPITTVDLRGRGIGDGGTQALCGALQFNTTVTALIFNDNYIGVYHLSNALRSNTTITALHVVNNNIGVKGARAIADMLLVNQSLTTLDLSSNSIGDDGLKSLCEALKVNETLTDLKLGGWYGNNIGDGGARALGDVLLTNNTLTSVNLRNNKIGDIGAKGIAEGLLLNKTLVNLHIKANPIGDTGVKALGEALIVNKALTTLVLGGNGFNHISNTGAIALADALLINTTLTCLHIESTYIGDEGALALGEALRSNKTLKTLNLDTNLIGDTGSQVLRYVQSFNNTVEIVSLECKNTVSAWSMPEDEIDLLDDT